MKLNLFQWIKISIVNLLLVTVLGVCLRYKILLPFPIVDQKHLLHAHSHFAFTGWITQTLMVLIVTFLNKKMNKDLFNKYQFLLKLNLVAAWGMLVSFVLEGYGTISITFSTLSIFIGYLFTIIVWKDFNKIKTNKISIWWFKVALLSNVLSSLGAFALAFLMANKIVHQNFYLLAQYFFLHFQYNGWFFFACMGLLTSHYFESFIDEFKLKLVFFLFTFALIPAFFLSALWMKLPLWIYIIIVLAAIAQCIAWIFLIYHLKCNYLKIKKNISGKLIRNLLVMVAVATTIKILLQLVSIHPSLSDFAFGFRPIVIGYLHLVLLGIISLSILVYILTFEIFSQNRLIKKAVLFFTFFIIVNEVLLMLQGLSALSYTIIPYINEALLVTAFFLFVSTLLLLIGLFKTKVISIINH